MLEAAKAAAKSAAARGLPTAAESAPTVNRKPWMLPSAGRTAAGPWEAYDQEPPLPSQNDQ